MTFADFAATENRFRKHFRSAPPDSWHDDMLPLVDYIDLSSEEREDKFPYIWTINSKQQLSRLLVDDSIVLSSEDRRQHWWILKDLAGIVDKKTSPDDIEQRIRQQVLDQVSSGLMKLISGDVSTRVTPKDATTTIAEQNNRPEQQGDYMAPWIDSDECTSCDECTDLNSDIFEYNDNKLAFIKNPNGGPFSDLVKAAERCTAQVIHPGLPKTRDEKDINKWIKRAESYN